MLPSITWASYRCNNARKGIYISMDLNRGIRAQAGLKQSRLLIVKIKLIILKIKFNWNNKILTHVVMIFTQAVTSNFQCLFTKNIV